MLIAFFSFIAAVALSCAFVPFVRRIAWRVHAIDFPETAPARKFHGNPIPLLGGLAVWGAFFVVVFIALAWGVDFTESRIQQKHLVGIFIASALLMIGGFLDDRYHRSPLRQFFWPLLAAIVVIASGIGITYVTNPFGGPLGTEQLRLDAFEKILFWFRGVPYKITLFADFFTLLWLLGMMYTTKFLDGLDGLASGVGVIGALIIAAVSFDPVVGQEGTGLLALIFAGALLGFLLWNWHPAKIFLGEGGSLFVGFMLGILSIVSGSKVATTVLVMSIPILDVAWVIMRRMLARGSPFRGDRRHLHFRLLDLGLSHRSAVLLLCALTAYFGIAAILAQSKRVTIASVFLLVFLGILGTIWFRARQRPSS